MANVKLAKDFIWNSLMVVLVTTLTLTIGVLLYYSPWNLKSIQIMQINRVCLVNVFSCPNSNGWEKEGWAPLKKKKKILLMYPLSAYVSKPKKNANLETWEWYLHIIKALPLHAGMNPKASSHNCNYDIFCVPT